MQSAWFCTRVDPSADFALQRAMLDALTKLEKPSPAQWTFALFATFSCANWALAKVLLRHYCPPLNTPNNDMTPYMINDALINNEFVKKLHLEKALAILRAEYTRQQSSKLWLQLLDSPDKEGITPLLKCIDIRKTDYVKWVPKQPGSLCRSNTASLVAWSVIVNAMLQSCRCPCLGCGKCIC